MKIRADEVELGDMISVEDGDLLAPHKVTGWFVDARGRMVIEWANQWHTFSSGELLEKEVAHGLT